MVLAGVKERQVPKDLKPLDTVLVRPWQLAFLVFAIAPKQKHTLIAVCKIFPKLRKFVEWLNPAGPATGNVSRNERWFCRSTHDVVTEQDYPRLPNAPPKRAFR